ncbi:hypothetical protein [Modestobacter sp. URMC 112]
MTSHVSSSIAPVRRRRLQRRPVRAGRPAPPAGGALAVELLRLYEEGHRCFCPDCRSRAREREVRRRHAGSTP